jgi:hypothetical protein
MVVHDNHDMTMERQFPIWNINKYNQESGQIEAELHVPFYFQKIRNHIFKFQKILKKIIDVANDIIYKHAKSQCEFLNTLGYTKIRNMWI